MPAIHHRRGTGADTKPAEYADACLHAKRICRRPPVRRCALVNAGGARFCAGRELSIPPFRGIGEAIGRIV